MMITETSKRVIPFRSRDAKSVGEGCFYLDFIIWLNGDRAELGDRVAFNYGCFVNAYGGLTVGDGATFGPYTMLHTANHNYTDLDEPIVDQGWESRPVEVGSGAWIGMGVVILPGVRIGKESVVGAGSVVTKDVEDYCVAVGAPAKPIKSRR